MTLTKVHLCATTAMYVANGFTDSQDLYGRAVDFWREEHEQGHLELFQELARIATRLDLLRYKLEKQIPGLDYPGVFPYEVAEPLGKWIANRYANRVHLTDPEVNVEMVKRVAEFFQIDANAVWRAFNKLPRGI